MRRSGSTAPVEGGVLPGLPLSRSMDGVVYRGVDGTHTGRRIYALTRRNSTPAVDRVVDALKAAADGVRLDNSTMALS